MAVLTATQARDARRTAEKSGIAINYTKAQANAAFQAIEDWFEGAGIKAAVSGVIDAATAPLVLTAAQKKQIVRAWLAQKFIIET
jgi:hypothetical protein